MCILDQLQKGSLLPTLTLGGEEYLGALRGRHNLVLVHSHPPGCSECEHVLVDLAANLEMLRENHAEILVMVPGSAAEVQALAHRLGLPFTVSAVQEGEFGSTATLVVTDRFGEVFAIIRADNGDHSLLTVAKLVEELDFVELQCPE